MTETKTFQISDYYFKHGAPQVNGSILTYHISPKEQMDRFAIMGDRSATLDVNLLSPFITGMNPDQMELVNVDLDARTVTVRIK
jgi:hypothetical protein